MTSDRQGRAARRFDWLLFLAIALVVLATIVPFIWVFLSSVRSDIEIFGTPIGLPAAWQWENYSKAWREGNFQRYFLNSVVVALGTTAITAIVAGPAGYHFSRGRGRLTRIVFYVFLFGMTLPVQAIIIPIFYQLRDYGLLNTQLGLIVVLVAVGLPFSCYLMRSHFRDLPEELFDAAEVDGASPWGVFMRIALPLSLPVLGAVSVFVFLISWNEYLLALLILLTADSRTIPVGIVRFQLEHSSDYGALFAGIVMAVVPSILIYVAMNRSFVQGLTTGGTKG